MLSSSDRSEETFCRLFNPQTQADVFRFAYRLTGNYNDAQDLFQETTLRALGAFNNLRNIVSFIGWMKRIAFNLRMDQQKKNKRQGEVNSFDDPYVNENGDTLASQIEDTRPIFHPQICAERAQDYTRICEALDKLSPVQRDMITAFHYKGLSYEELAKRYKIPLGTVKSRLNRTRMQLSQHLHEEDFR